MLVINTLYENVLIKEMLSLFFFF